MDGGKRKCRPRMKEIRGKRQREGRHNEARKEEER